MLLRKSISKNIGFPIKDYHKGTRIIKTLDFLLESQYWNEEKLYDYRLNKLKKLIDYSKANVPYYEKEFGKIKLTSRDIKTLDDVDKIPILTKKIARKENFNLISRSYNKKYVKKGKTGGTTGSPLILYKDIFNRSFTWASYYRWYQWMGINYYDSVVSLWGAKRVTQRSVRKDLIERFTNFLQNDKVYDSFRMDEKEMFRIYNDLEKRKPVLLKGYLSSMLNFSRFLEEREFSVFGLKAISSTTETLLPHNREYLEKTLDAKMFDQYGCGEVSAISYECSSHKGLHINQEHVICEVHDQDNNSIINKSGRIIATDLDNFVMPFIRFENGDLATLSNDKCDCGVNQPLMKSIEGRSADTITLKNGNKVHGVFFTDILYELNILSGLIHKFQVYQPAKEKIEFRVEVDKPLDNKTHKKIKNELNRFFEEVTIIETKEIPVEDNGKFKYIISNI